MRERARPCLRAARVVGGLALALPGACWARPLPAAPGKPDCPPQQQQ